MSILFLARWRGIGGVLDLCFKNITLAPRDVVGVKEGKEEDQAGRPSCGPDEG